MKGEQGDLFNGWPEDGDPIAQDLISEYYKGNRTAQIKKDTQGFYVLFWEAGTLMEKRDLYKHSLAYSEDTAENWVERIIP